MHELLGNSTPGGREVSSVVVKSRTPASHSFFLPEALSDNDGSLVSEKYL